MTIVGGILTTYLDNPNRKAFLGMGFGEGGVPIDILPIYHLSSFVDDFSLLIVDKFLELNGTDKDEVRYLKNKLLGVLGNLKEIYGLNPKIISCSEFMSSGDYLKVFKEVKEQVGENEELSSRLLETVPDDKRSIPSARDYPIHELACVKFLSFRACLIACPIRSRRSSFSNLSLFGVPSLPMYLSVNSSKP